jgi:5-methylcytosine-specific restriction protein B
MNLPVNTILYGPPGTGKTLATTALALACVDAADTPADAKAAADATITGNYREMPDKAGWGGWVDSFDKLRREGRIEFTTFHQNYAYEDFIEGIRAKADGEGKVHYSTEPGVFKRIAYRALYAWLTGNPCPLVKAEDFTGAPATKLVRDWLLTGERPDDSRKDDDVPRYVLVIDEINRGNMARIMGELITLIEDSKRARRKVGVGQQPLSAVLPYSAEPFIVPPNLYIIGTMNTADRSLTGLDLALRRRFCFVELEPKSEALCAAVTDDSGSTLDLRKLLECLNERIEAELDRDLRIGHAFLVNVKTNKDLAEAMRKKVLPLLFEYFHDRPDMLRRVLGKAGGGDTPPCAFVKFTVDTAAGQMPVRQVQTGALSLLENYSALMGKAVGD